MINMLNNKKMMLFIVFCLVFSIGMRPTLALKKADLETNLIRNSIANDFSNIQYSSECLSECHIPLKVKGKGQLLNLKITDIKTHKTKLKGLDNIKGVSIKYLKEETFTKEVWHSEISCDPYTEKTLNKTEIEIANCEDNGYMEYVEDTRLVWTSTPTRYKGYYHIDFMMSRPASLGNKGVDLVPEIKGVMLDDYAWLNSSWQYRTCINLTSNEAIDLSNFPANFIFDTRTPVLAGKMNADCSDLRVTDSDGNEIPFGFLDGKDDSNYGCAETLTTFVSLPPLLASNDSSYICLYYGNALATIPTDNIEDVFDSYSLVLTNMTTDLSGNNQDFSSSGTPTKLSTGIIGNVYNFDGIDDYWNYTSSFTAYKNNANGTLEMWLNSDDDELFKTWFTYTDFPSTRRNLLNIYTDGCSSGACSPAIMFLRLAGDDVTDFAINNTNELISTANAWHYMVLRTRTPEASQNGTEWFYNGTLSDSIYFDNGVSSDHYWFNDIGNANPQTTIGAEYFNNNYGNYYDGLIDEIRISNISRSDEWISATYDYISTQMYTIGLEENETGPPIPNVTITANLTEYIDYFCDDDVSIKNITNVTSAGFTTILTNTNCRYGCNENNFIITAFSNEADLCNINPFITDVIIVLSLAFVIWLFIKLLSRRRK